MSAPIITTDVWIPTIYTPVIEPIIETPIYVPNLPERKNTTRCVIIPIEPESLPPEYIPNLPDRSIQYVRPPYIAPPVPESDIIVKRSNWRRVPASDTEMQGLTWPFFKPSQLLIATFVPKKI